VITRMTMNLFHEYRITNMSDRDYDRLPMLISEKFGNLSTLAARAGSVNHHPEVLSKDHLWELTETHLDNRWRLTKSNEAEWKVVEVSVYTCTHCGARETH
jgi:hypothetical protein